MKITIAYTSSEDPKAAAVVAVLRDLLPGVRVHKNDAKNGFYHVFLTTKKPASAGDFKGNA